MPLASSTALRQLSDGNSVGTVMGRSGNDPIAFYGATSGVTQWTLSTAASQSVSSNAVASTIAFALNRMGLIICSTIAA